MPPTYPSLAFIRSFTTTLSRLARPSDSLLKHRHREIPKYPYGPSTIYKQSNFGLYGNATIQFGNKVSERNEIKSRRRWKPNVHSKRLWSEAMGKFIRVRVLARVLRTIDKVGGLDEYLLGDKAARIKELGMEGWGLRYKLMQTASVKERFRLEKIALGMDVPSEEEMNAEKEEKAAMIVEKKKSSEERRRIREERARREKDQAKESEGAEKDDVLERIENK